MSIWVRMLVWVTFSLFAGGTFIILAQGALKAAAGMGIFTVLVLSLFLEVTWPGRYMLRRPDGELEDTWRNRLKQFRIECPGRDGTLLLGVLWLLKYAVVAGFVFQLIRAII